MLSFHMFAATQPRRSLDSLSGSIPGPRPLTPNFLICHTSENALLSPTIATLPKMSLSKPSVCHIYDTAGGLGPRRPFGLSDLRTFQHVLGLSPVFSHSCALFCTFLHSPKTQPFYFQAIPHSLLRNGGWVRGGASGNYVGTGP